MATGSSEQSSVIVVGGGPVGLTLSCLLARHGVAVRLLEQSVEYPSASRGARGTSYQPRTLEIFDDLDVIANVLADTWTDVPIRVYRNGELLGDGSAAVAARPPSPTVPYPNMARPVATWRLEEILLERARALGVHVETGRRVVGLEQDDEGVTVDVEASTTTGMTWGHALDGNGDGAPSKAEAGERPVTRHRARYVIGCDGGHSTVRRLAGIGFDVKRDHGHVGLVAEVTVSGVEPTYARLWQDEVGNTVFLSPIPISGTFQMLVNPQRLEDGSQVEPTIEVAQRLLDAVPWPNRIVIGDVRWKSVFKIREALADRYRSGRVFIAGDAAHIHSPMGGQGVNMGIQDANNLGWKLAYVVNGDAAPDVLDTYEDERRPAAVETLQWTGDQHSERFSATPPKPEQERLTGTATGGRLEQYDQASQLGVCYPWSGLNGGSGAVDRLTLGDRAPDGRVIRSGDGRRLRLFDLFRGGHFSLLLFGVERMALAGEVAERHGRAVHPIVVKGIDDVVGDPSPPAAVAVVVDPHGMVADAYGAHDRPIVLVRPDGHVVFQAAADDQRSLLTYLDQLLIATPAS